MDYINLFDKKHGKNQFIKDFLYSFENILETKAYTEEMNITFFVENFIIFIF